MRRANRPLALALLLIAVVCSPAGVCLLDGVAAASPTASSPAHGHACCRPAKGTILVANDESCCSMPGTGFVNVLRFTLQDQAATVAAGFRLAAPTPVRFAASPAVTIRPPLVLRV